MPESALSEIPITLHLSKVVEAKLAERAAATGQSLDKYIATLVESVLDSPRTFEQISGPVYQRFLDSGTTDEQISEELEQAKHETRAQRRARQAS